MDRNTLTLLEYDGALAQLAALTQSVPGREAALALSPGLAPSDILESWAMIEEAREILNQAGHADFSEHLNLAPLFERLKVEGAILDAEDLRAVGFEARTSKVARSFFASQREIAPKLAALADGLSALPLLIDAIERTIGPDGEILDSASPELARLRLESAATRQGLTQKLSGLMRSDSFRHIVQDELITTRQDRFVVPVKASAAGQKRGLVHDWSKTGATAFLEPMEAVEDNNRLSLLKRKEKQEIERILRRLSDECRLAAPELLESGAILTRLDVIMAEGRLAKNWSAISPEYAPGQGFFLREARHPLLAARLTGKGARMTPLDLKITPEKPLLIVSGLNTGGKTVAMKTLGLNLLMAKAGLLLPVAYGSRLDFPDEILAVMGDEQDLSSDLSTFSGHVRSLSKVLASARPGALILLDEIGSGTDPAEGAALGLSVLEQLLPSGALIMAATHYQLIKTWAALTERVESAAVNSSDSGQPLFGLSYGSPGFSGGLRMARRLGLPAELVDKAESYLDDGQRRAMDLLAKLDEERGELVKTREALDAEKMKLARAENDLRLQIKERGDEFNRRAEALDRSIKELLVKSKNEFETLKREMREACQSSHKQLPAFNEKRAAIEKQLRAARPQKVSEDSPLQSVAEGDEVLVKKLGRKAIVRSVNSERGEAWVDAGGLNVKVPLAELFAAPIENSRRERKTATVTISPAEDVASLSINLLGQTVDEAIDSIEREIDLAVRQHRKSVTIIHGFGTGRLRQGIRAYLKSHPRVKSFAPAPQNSGGEGVTVAELEE